MVVGVLIGLESLADALEHLSELLQRDEPPEREWTLAAGYGIHDKLGALAQARARARANVRIAPRRWRLRATPRDLAAAVADQEM